MYSRTSIINATRYNASFSADAGTKLFQIWYVSITFDRTAADQFLDMFIDAGTIEGVASAQTSWPVMVSAQSLILGLGAFSFDSNTAHDISLQDSTPYNIISVNGYL